MPGLIAWQRHCDWRRAVGVGRIAQLTVITVTPGFQCSVRLQGKRVFASGAGGYKAASDADRA